MIGLDGATFDVLNPLFEAGKCPVLNRLVREGAHAHLNSTTPPMTLPSWSSFLTGCNPGRHGIYDFTRRIPGTYRLELTNSTHRSVPTIHRVLSDRGLRTACLAMPTTYPPEKLDGVVISGFDSPIATSIDGRFCHPPELYREIQSRFGGMAFADFQELNIDEAWHASALESMLAEIGRKEAIAGWMLEQERWELFTLLFGESDTVSHHFWMFREAGGPRFQDVPGLVDAIDRVYEALDAALGRLLERAQADVVCVASDHGFGGSGDVALYLNRFLEERGWLHFQKHTAPAKGHGSSTHVLDRARQAALRYLPTSAQQGLVRALPGRWIGAVESASRWGDVDFSRTRAFSDEMNYAATIHLNVEGRDPLGCVRDRDEAVEELTADLLGWEIEGERVVEKVWKREELYEGPCLDLAPDMVLELGLRDGFSYTVLPSGRARPGQTWRRFEPEEHVGGKGLGMNGSHRQHGVLILNGRGIRSGVQVEAGMPDCAPTLLALLGQPIPEHCDGRVLRQALEGVQVRWTEHGGTSPRGEQSLSPVEAAEVTGRLESLGYL